MPALEIFFWAAAVASFSSAILIDDSIAKDVSEALGTDYKGMFGLNGEKVWKEHQRLFPASRKRAALVGALVATFGSMMMGAYFGR